VRSLDASLAVKRESEHALSVMSGSVKRLLAVTAHPDDETFIMGGTLARYAAEGVAVHLLVTAKDTGDLGIVREAELKCGLAGFTFLDYVPGGMTWSPPGAGRISYLTTAPLNEAAERVAAEVRRVRPQVVVTFDPTGAYGHPDHITAGRAAKLAFERVLTEDGPDAPRKLYMAVFGRRWMRWGARALRLAPGRDPRRFGPKGDIDLVAALRESPRPTTYLDIRGYLETRRRAALCHRSQLAGAPWPLRRYETLPPGVRGRFFPREVFARVWPPPEPGMRERDLFAGLEG
jgi:LmbE family N-acetylglucosaminyl deacetylase